MTEWDDERPSITRRKANANIPPSIGKAPRLPWWLVALTVYPLGFLILFARECGR